MEYLKKNGEPLAIGALGGLFLAGWTSSVWWFGKLATLRNYFNTQAAGNPAMIQTTYGITWP